MAKQHVVITITNQFSSMGRVIAAQLGELLGIPCYNEYLTSQTAEALGLSEKLVRQSEERSRQMIADPFFSAVLFQEQRTSQTQEQIFAAQAALIRELAGRESCIIVGRCSDFVLSDDPDAVHFYIYAPFEDRVRHCMEELELGEEESRRLTARVDKERQAYHMNFAGFLPDDRRYKDLMVNSSLLGVENTSRLLAQVVRMRMAD